MEKNIIIVDEEYFKEHLSIFTNTKHCKLVRSFVVDEMFKDDLIHKKLMKAKKKASDEFYNYEFNKRHSIK